MKKLIFILGFIAICIIGYFAFPIAVAIMKILFGLVFVSLIGVGVLVGIANKKK